MVKHNRRPDKWTLEEIEADSEGYLEAQSNAATDAAAAAEKRGEAERRRRFERAFTQAGGTEAGAADEYEQMRNRQAGEAARVDDEAARRFTHNEQIRRL